MKIIMTLITILFLATTSFAAEISETDVKAFLDSWLAAQNKGSYSNYAAMYATRFQGIKRSGDRTSKFNHDKWLHDRKRMFKNKMTVLANNIQIKTLDTTATVTFEQTWESNGYKDKGDKQLYLVFENNLIRIAREEMLASKVLMGKNMVLDSTNFPFAFAMEEGIVIPDDNIYNINTKTMKLDVNETYYTVKTPVETKLLPVSTQSLLGMPVRIYGPEGICESEISGFMIVNKKKPHFGEIQRWQEEKTSRKKIALNIYNEGQQHLVATTKQCSGDFAKDARLPESPISIGKNADKETALLATKALKTFPSYKTDIKPFIKDGYHESIKTFAIKRLGKTETWVSMYVVSGTPYCGQEGGILGALWIITEGTKGKQLKLVQYISDDLEYATDIENDGSPEFIYRDSIVSTDFFIMRTNDSKKQDIHFKGCHDYDCPC